MPVIRTNHVKIVGVGSGLPKNKMSIYDVDKDNYFPKEKIDKMHNNVGINNLYEADINQTAADLCYPVAEALIEKLGWEKDSIDGLIFSTETPDYTTPATACFLQGKLGLSTDCIAIDITSGCPGSINTIGVGSQFIETGACRRVLILLGNTVRRTTSKQDYGLAYLISDAGAAVALEYTEEENPTTIIMYADGSQYEKLILPTSGFRHPKTPETAIVKEDEYGNRRSMDQYYMDGHSIFDFAARAVPRILKEVRKEHGWEEDDVDYYLLHQPNLYMVNLIIKRAKSSTDKFPINITKYGNTSNASISLLMNDLNDENKLSNTNLVMSSFGGGLYWNAVATHVDDVCCIKMTV
ncbi:MAG: ketoacyl-ACP synthase III [Clostridia bacterium]|nr:ketoacyl-ACP synthase III [Clostridia bacterium]